MAIIISTNTKYSDCCFNNVIFFSLAQVIDSNIIPRTGSSSPEDNVLLTKTAPEAADDKSIKTVPESHEAAASSTHNATVGGHSVGFSVFHMDFPRVQLPFIIGVWILSASIAKIGKLSATECVSVNKVWVLVGDTELTVIRGNK